MYLLALCTLTSKANENLIVAQNQRKAKSPEKKKKYCKVLKFLYQMSFWLRRHAKFQLNSHVSSDHKKH